jgi:hypothetical protein
MKLQIPGFPAAKYRETKPTVLRSQLFSKIDTLFSVTYRAHIS